MRTGKPDFTLIEGKILTIQMETDFWGRGDPTTFPSAQRFDAVYASCPLSGVPKNRSSVTVRHVMAS
jgi:hypothetical protein